jgi:transcriptional regulator with XRE-family HTH domain
MTAPQRLRTLVRPSRVDHLMEVLDPALLRQTREDRRWSQREFADEIGCSHTTVHYGETGQRRVGTHIAVRWAAALDLPLERVFRENCPCGGSQSENRPRRTCDRKTSSSGLADELRAS